MINILESQYKELVYELDNSPKYFAAPKFQAENDRKHPDVLREKYEYYELTTALWNAAFPQDRSRSYRSIIAIICIIVFPVFITIALVEKLLNSFVVNILNANGGKKADLPEKLARYILDCKIGGGFHILKAMGQPDLKNNR